MSDFTTEMHQFDFDWCSVPDPAGGAYSASPNPLAGFKGPYFSWEVRKGREGKRRERWAGEGDGLPVFSNS